jgi:hypothetical protein
VTAFIDALLGLNGDPQQTARSTDCDAAADATM